VLLDLIAKAPGGLRRLVVASSMSLYGEGAFLCPACGGQRAGERTAERLEAGRWEVPCAHCGADMEPRPTSEDKPPEIASVYAATKKHQEDLAVSFGRAWRIPTFALRFFNVFGPRQSLSNPYTGVAAIFLSRLLNGHAPLVFEDGGQARDFIDVRDIAQAVLMAVESDRAGAHVLNVATGRKTTVVQVAAALSRALGIELAPQLMNKYRAGDIRHCYGDPARAREVLGFQARYTFEEGLPALIDWCRREQPEDKVEDSLQELERRRLVQ